MSTQTLLDIEIDPITGEPFASHIVAPKEGKSASEIVMEARIYGIAIEAVCGHRWIPQRDPKNYPMCSKCKELWELRFGDDEGPDHS